MRWIIVYSVIPLVHLIDCQRRQCESCFLLLRVLHEGQVRSCSTVHNRSTCTRFYFKTKVAVTSAVLLYWSTVTSTSILEATQLIAISIVRTSVQLYILDVRLIPPSRRDYFSSFRARISNACSVFNSSWHRGSCTACIRCKAYKVYNRHN